MTVAPNARLKDRYESEIRPALMERFGYSTPHQAPRIEKITLNMGVGEAKQDSKMLEAAQEQLGIIAGQRPNIRRARKSIAAFKLREDMPVGVSVTLRGTRGYEFLDRLLSIAIPRIRDFRGLNPRSFDGRGNYSLGVREQIIFPEIDYDSIDQVRGLDITITTSARSDEEGLALLEAFGMPFARDRRPGAEAPAEQAAAPPAAEPTPVEEKAAAEEAAAEEAGAEESPSPGTGEALPGEAADAEAANVESPTEDEAQPPPEASGDDQPHPEASGEDEGRTEAASDAESGGADTEAADSGDAAPGEAPGGEPDTESPDSEES